MKKQKNKLEIIYLNIDQVKPWDKNPKDHNIEAIIASMEEFDITQPILVHKGSKMIVAGHGRYEAFKHLEMKKVPVILLDMPLKKAKAYAMVDNQTTMMRGWDEDLYPIALHEIHLEYPGFNLELYEFEVPEPEPEDLEERDLPPLPKKPKTKVGDLYLIDNKHRVLCGDSTKAEDMKRLMGGKKADMVFTDPPYGIGYEYKGYDDVQGNEYIKFLDQWTKLILKMAPLIVITTGWKYKSYWYGLHPSDELVWFDKTKQSGGRSFHLRKTEPIFIFGKVIEKYKWDIFEVEGDRGDGIRETHTCPKPLKLIIDILNPQTSARSIVLDPFLGSGTTLIASEQLYRTCYGMEIDPAYVDVILERYKNYKYSNGEKAIIKKIR